jgi:hypothetical protein
LLGVRLVGWIGGGGDSQRIEDRCLGIFGVSRTQAGHGAFISQHPCMLIGLGGIRKEFGDGMKIVTLTLGLQRGSARLLDCFESLPYLRRILEPRCERVSPVAQRDAPICHRTGWVGHENRVESLNRIGKLKRMH